jgi:hypothetical protein
MGHDLTLVMLAEARSSICFREGELKKRSRRLYWALELAVASMMTVLVAVAVRPSVSVTT